MTWMTVLPGLFIWRRLDSPSDQALMQWTAFPAGTQHERRHDRETFRMSEPLHSGQALRLAFGDPHALEAREHREHDPRAALRRLRDERNVVREADVLGIVQK